MSEAKSHVEVERGSDRNFGLVFAAVFFLVAAVPFFFSGNTHYWALILSIVFLALAIMAPKSLKSLNVLWFKFGMLLGAIIAPLVMMLIFFLVITPIGLLMRLFGKDPLGLRKNPKQGSYWIKRTADPENPASMKNQF